MKTHVLTTSNPHDTLYSVEGTHVTMAQMHGIARSKGFDGTQKLLAERVHRAKRALTWAYLVKQINKGRSDSLKDFHQRQRDEMHAVCVALDARKRITLLQAGEEE